MFFSSLLRSILFDSYVSQQLIFNLIFAFQIYVPTNPRGAEALPPGIVVSETDFYLRRLWGDPSEVRLTDVILSIYSIASSHGNGVCLVL